MNITAATDVEYILHHSHQYSTATSVSLCCNIEHIRHAGMVEYQSCAIRNTKKNRLDGHSITRSLLTMKVEIYDLHMPSTTLAMSLGFSSKTPKRTKICLGLHGTYVDTAPVVLW